MSFSNSASGRERQEIAYPYLNRSRAIHFSAYAPSVDTADCWDALQKAFNEAEGRELVFDSPFGGSRTYRFTVPRYYTSGGLRPLVLPKKSRLIWEDGAVLDFSGFGKDRSVAGNYMERTAAILRTIPLNSVASKSGTLFFSSTQATPPIKGWYYLQSDDVWTQMSPSNGTKSEWVYISGGNTSSATLVNRTKDSYTTNPRLVLIDMPSLRFDNAQIIGAGPMDTVGLMGDRALRVYHSFNTHMEGGDIRYCEMGIDFTGGLKGSIKNVNVVFDPLPAMDRNQYGITLTGGAQDWLIQGNSVTGSKEGLCLSDTGGTGDLAIRRGITRNITFRDNTVTGAWRSGICTHWNHEDVKIISNRIEFCSQGIDSRIRNVLIKDNYIKSTGTFQPGIDGGVQLGEDSQAVRLEGNVYEDCLRGVFMARDKVHTIPPGDIISKNEVFRGPRMINCYDIRAQFLGTAASNTPFGRISIENADAALTTDPGAGNVVPFQIWGKFTSVNITGRILGGNGSDLVSCTRYFHSSGSPLNSTDPEGGVSNLMTDLEYGSGYSGNVVNNFARGLAKIKKAGIGFNDPDE